VNVDLKACDAAWRAYLNQLSPDHPHRQAKPDAFGFGGEADVADELAELVLAGRKRATTSLAIEFTSLSEPLPIVGDVSIILRGDGVPVAIIERTQVTTRPFDAVDEAFAAVEGEGDGSLAYWRQAHAEYFTGVCTRLGRHFDTQTPVICQVFRVVWKSPARHPAGRPEDRRSNRGARRGNRT
jgi:uncharacterized protein YhfF